MTDNPSDELHSPRNGLTAPPDEADEPPDVPDDLLNDAPLHRLAALDELADSLDPSLREYRSVIGVAAAAQPSQEQVLDALTMLNDQRRNLDRLERWLIEAARQKRTGWSRIAASLGLASRQAAEQRYLRLCGEPGRGRDPRQVRLTKTRQRIVDNMYGPQIGVLRTAAAAAHRQIDADLDWDGRNRRAALARASLEAAITAEPGSLYALVDQAVQDLDGLAPDGLPAGLGRAIRRLRWALAAARPA